MELYDEIKKELLEEEALWALEEEPIEEPLESTQPVPCPSCAQPLESHEESGMVSFYIYNSPSDLCLVLSKMFKMSNRHFRISIDIGRMLWRVVQLPCPF